MYNPCIPSVYLYLVYLYIYTSLKSRKLEPKKPIETQFVFVFFYFLVVIPPKTVSSLWHSFKKLLKPLRTIWNWFRR